jgi:thiamine biosynthesis lipoprotein ApbE
LALLAAIAVVFMSSPREVWVTRTYPIMGTIAEVKLFGPREKAEKAADITRDVFEEVEKSCGTFAPESELYKLNHSAHERPARVGGGGLGIVIRVPQLTAAAAD